MGYNGTTRGSSACLALTFLEVCKDGPLQRSMSADFTENEIKSFRPAGSVVATLGHSLVESNKLADLVTKGC